MRKRLLSILTTAFVLATAVALVGCGDTASHTAPADTEPAETEPAPVAAEPRSTWEKGGLTVTALRDFARFPGATLSLENIAAGQALPSGAPVAFDFTSTDYALGEQTADAGSLGLANSAQGQHIHLILNNGPYSAHYEADFEMQLEDGYYVALAFLSRSYHMSVKDAGAATVVDFTVGDAGEHEKADLSAPHLFYSRPKGTYVGADTDKLMLDFYPVNTTISADGNKVRATIAGNEFVFSEWVPYVIEGLPKGEVEITLELIDASGAVIPGPFNQVTRTVTLEDAPADDA